VVTVATTIGKKGKGNVLGQIGGKAAQKRGYKLVE